MFRPLAVPLALMTTLPLSACVEAETASTPLSFACPTLLPPVVHSEVDPIVDPADYPTLLQSRRFWELRFQHGSDAQLLNLIRDGDPQTGYHRNIVNRVWWQEAKDLYNWRVANNCPDVPDTQAFF